MRQKKLVGTGHAKLLLFGEHVALLGAPALGLSLPWYVRLCLAVESHAQLKIDASNSAVIRELFRSAGIEAGGVLTLASTMPVGCGWGFSAALSVAIAILARRYAFLQGADRNRASRSTQALWEAAQLLENRLHGRSSGIDTGLSLWGGLRAFECADATGQSARIEPAPASYPVQASGPVQAPRLPRTRSLHPVGLGRSYLLYGYLPRAESTQALIQKVAAARQTDDLQRLGEIARAALALLDSASMNTRTGSVVADEPHAVPQLNRLGRLADEAHRHLQSLGLSTPLLDECLAIGRRYGSLGGKLSGAGGGGAWYMLFDDDWKAAEAEYHIRNRLKARTVGQQLQRHHVGYPADMVNRTRLTDG